MKAPIIIIHQTHLCSNHEFLSLHQSRINRLFNALPNLFLGIVNLCRIEEAVSDLDRLFRGIDEFPVQRCIFGSLVPSSSGAVSDGGNLGAIVERDGGRFGIIDHGDGSSGIGVRVG